MIEATITCGAHPLAQLPESTAQLQQEMLEKVDQEYAHLVAWDSIKDNPLPNLKKSPIATIPHKSCRYHMILDLSYGITISNTRYPFVNESTQPDVTPTHAMAELNHVLPCLIYTVVTAPEIHDLILFTKLDVKDGYWQMVVDPDDEWNFAYILPKLMPAR